MRISDSQSGLRVIKKSSLQKMDLCERGMPFATELLIQCSKKNLKIKEHPIKYRARKGGDAKLVAAKDGVIIIKTLIKNFIKR